MSQGQTSQRLRPFKPTRFGRYTLLLPLNTGGMGEIFLARLEGSHGFDKLCVIKKILPHLAQDQDFVSRFVDEAHILVKLSHGNVAQVLDMGVHDGAPYIALEFVDGKDLRRVLSRMRDRKLPLPLSFVLAVITRVLDALAYAHRKRDDQDHELNLVHRDISPQNVLISYEGEVKVIDFGLAKSALSASRTNPSIVMGKFMYMSPEQARHKAVDRRSDLYAVGLCLWELVAGKNPFEDVPPGELMAKVANPTIPPLNTVEPLCPQALSEAVAKSLAVDPAQRFQTAEEFRGKLQTILQQIDPSAGAETTSRFMRDAFASEYQFERRMLTTVKEQAKELEALDEPSQGAEETVDNVPSPFAQAARPTPIATPAVRLADEPTPLGRPALEGPTPLSFQPTRKTSSGLSKAHKSGSDHEKETLPSIQLKTDLAVPTPPLAPAPAAPTPEKIRARVLAKSFDQEATEASTPAMAEPEPLPSIVIDGLPSEPVRTELELPAQVAPPPSPPAARAKKAEPKPKPKKPKAREPAKPEKTGEKPLPRSFKPTPLPVMPARTDTQVLEQVSSRPPPRAPAKTNRWLWFAVPVIAIVGLGGFIAFDLHLDAQRREQEEAHEQEQPAQEPEAEAPPEDEVRAPPPEAGEVAPEAPRDAAPAPKKKAPAPVKVATRTAGSPGASALADLKGDYAQLVDEAVQRKFRLQVTALESQVEEKGSDPAFVQKVERLHEQIKTALGQQR
jgi:serine/threonine-protein kinase